MPESIEKLQSNSDAVLSAWQDNADAWTDAIRQQKIQSRTLVTNQAISDAVLALNPASVLDLGCGEGWLSWRLAAAQIEVLGVDAIGALVDAATRFRTIPSSFAPEFLQVSYPQIANTLKGRSFDVAICNFSLLDKDDTATLLSSIPDLLGRHGKLLIQTLHPAYVSTPAPDSDGWRIESWSGIGDNFKGSSPWYYRTLASWHNLFSDSGLRLIDTLEPVHPHTGLPASIIFVLRTV